MGFRFQKRIKLLPGVTLNLSKSGVSTSVGHKGAKVTVGHGKVRSTVGLPGSGLSHTTIHKAAAEPKATTDTPMPIDETPISLYVIAAIGFIFLLIWIFK